MEGWWRSDGAGYGAGDITGTFLGTPGSPAIDGNSVAVPDRTGYAHGPTHHQQGLAQWVSENYAAEPNISSRRLSNNATPSRGSTATAFPKASVSDPHNQDTKGGRRNSRGPTHKQKGQPQPTVETYVPESKVGTPTPGDYTQHTIYSQHHQPSLQPHTLYTTTSALNAGFDTQHQLAEQGYLSSANGPARHNTYSHQHQYEPVLKATDSDATIKIKHQSDGVVESTLPILPSAAHHQSTDFNQYSPGISSYSTSVSRPRGKLQDAYPTYSTKRTSNVATEAAERLLTTPHSDAITVTSLDASASQDPRNSTPYSSHSSTQYDSSVHIGPAGLEMSDARAGPARQPKDTRHADTSAVKSSALQTNTGSNVIPHTAQDLWPQHIMAVDLSPSSNLVDTVINKAHIQQTDPVSNIPTQPHSEVTSVTPSRFEPSQPLASRSTGIVMPQVHAQQPGHASDGSFQHIPSTSTAATVVTSALQEAHSKSHHSATPGSQNSHELLAILDTLGPAQYASAQSGEPRADLYVPTASMPEPQLTMFHESRPHSTPTGSVEDQPFQPSPVGAPLDVKILNSATPKKDASDASISSTLTPAEAAPVINSGWIWDNDRKDYYYYNYTDRCHVYSKGTKIYAEAQQPQPLSTVPESTTKSPTNEQQRYSDSTDTQRNFKSSSSMEGNLPIPLTIDGATVGKEHQTPPHKESHMPNITQPRQVVTQSHQVPELVRQDEHPITTVHNVTQSYEIPTRTNSTEVPMAAAQNPTVAPRYQRVPRSYGAPSTHPSNPMPVAPTTMVSPPFITPPSHMRQADTSRSGAVMQVEQTTISLHTAPGTRAIVPPSPTVQGNHASSSEPSRDAGKVTCVLDLSSDDVQVAVNATISGAAVVKKVKSSVPEPSYRDHRRSHTPRTINRPSSSAISHKVTEQLINIIDSSIYEALQGRASSQTVLKIIHAGDTPDREKAAVADAIASAQVCDDLKLESSTEAAAVDALKCSENQTAPEAVKPGDKVVVCHTTATVIDATTYAIGSADASLQEVVAGEGKNNGARSIDDELREWVKRTFSNGSYPYFDLDHIEPGTPFASTFQKIKETFGSEDQEDDEFFLPLRMRSVPSSRYYSSSRRMVKVPSNRVELFFQPTLRAVKEVLDHQVSRAQAASVQVEKVLFLGELARFPYMKKHVQQWCYTATTSYAAYLRFVCYDRP